MPYSNRQATIETKNKKPETILAEIAQAKVYLDYINDTFWVQPEDSLSTDTLKKQNNQLKDMLDKTGKFCALLKAKAPGIYSQVKSDFESTNQSSNV